MFKKILLLSFPLLLMACHKGSPVSPPDENTQTNENKWREIAELYSERVFFCSAEVNGKIYLIGGYNGSTFYDEVEEYNLQTNKSTVKNKMPEKIFGMAAAETGGKIYTFGGRTESFYYGTTSNHTYQYDPVADSWTRKKNMPSSRAFLTASAVDEKIYTIGGSELGYEGCSTVQMYDPVSDTWTDKANLPKATGFHTAHVFNGKIYVVGGGISNSGSSMGTSYPYFFVYDPATDSWNIKADIEPSRYMQGAVILNNKLFICGGVSSYMQGEIDHYTLLYDLKEYDFNSDTWTARASMPSHRRAFQACAYNNKLYVFGGFTGDPKGSHSALNSVLEYVPL